MREKLGFMYEKIEDEASRKRIKITLITLTIKMWEEREGQTCTLMRCLIHRI